MIKFKNKINFLNLFYMKKKYGDKYNKNLILNFSYKKFQKLFELEEKKIVYQYNIYVINEYIKENYKYTINFLNSIKKILKKYKIKLVDLDEQELQLLEERVFSIERHIKVLPTNFQLKKNEKIGIKFINSKMWQIIEKKISLLINEGELLISNYRIIFNRQTILYWKNIEKINYSENGFTFNYKNKNFIITIHDNETLNNTIKNFINKINNNI